MRTEVPDTGLPSRQSALDGMCACKCCALLAGRSLMPESRGPSPVVTCGAVSGQEVSLTCRAEDANFLPFPDRHNTWS